MLTKIVGRVVSQDGAVIQSGTVLFQTKKSGIFEKSLRAPGTEIRNILDGMIEDISLTPGVYTVHVLPDGSLDAPWNFRIALDGTLPEVDLFEQAPIDDIGGYDKTSLIAAIAESVDPVLGGYVTDAQASQAAAKISETNADGSASTASTSAGTATTQANRAMAEADRAQALANDIGTVATMRVDTSVGERVFVSNGAGVERMVKGETGWRHVHSLLTANWRLWANASSPSTIAYAKLSREGSRCSLVARIEPTELLAGKNRFDPVNIIENMPQGFRFPNVADLVGDLVAYFDGARGMVRNNSQAVESRYATGTWKTGGAGNLEGLTLIKVTWTTNDPWPTALPGTPA